MPYQLVVFDCDGVMFDSRRANETFYNDIRSHFGMPRLTQDEIKYVQMATAEQSVDYIIPDPALKPKAQELRLQVDYSAYIQLLDMEPGLVTLLEYLQGRYLTAVATNRSDTIGPLMDFFNLTQYFDMIVSSLNVTRPKPDPEQLDMILRELKVPSYKAVFIGDSETDARAAQAAGVDFIAYKNLELSGRYHVNRMDQVQNILQNGP